MSGIYFALIGAKKYAASLTTILSVASPNEQTLFGQLKFPRVSILKHVHGFYYRVPMFSAFLQNSVIKSMMMM